MSYYSTGWKPDAFEPTLCYLPELICQWLNNYEHFGVCCNLLSALERLSPCRLDARNSRADVLPEAVQSSSKLFADDTKIYCKVDTESGPVKLQKDLDAATRWSDLWQMPFNASKCSSLHIGASNTHHVYHTRGKNLDQSSSEKDLGVRIDSVLKFREQAASAASKGNQVLALIRRSFQNINADSLPLLFKTFVRPHLEYGNAAWGPFNRADQKLLERVQRRATKLVQNIKHLPYPERLRHLKIPSLYYRRRRGDMITIYQLLNGGLNIEQEQLFTLADTTTTRGHPLKLKKPQAFSRVRRNTGGASNQRLELASLARCPLHVCKPVQGPPWQALEWPRIHHPWLSPWLSIPAYELGEIGTLQAKLPSKSWQW